MPLKSIPVTVVKVHIRGQPQWCVYRRVEGKRKRTFYKNKVEAERERDELLDQIRAGGQAWFSLSPNEKAEVMLAYTKAKQYGISLLLAVEQAVSGLGPVGPKLGVVITELFSRPGTVCNKSSANSGNLWPFPPFQELFSY